MGNWNRHSPDTNILKTDTRCTTIFCNCWVHAMYAFTRSGNKHDRTTNPNQVVRKTKLDISLGKEHIKLNTAQNCVWNLWAAGTKPNMHFSETTNHPYHSLCTILPFHTFPQIQHTKIKTNLSNQFRENFFQNGKRCHNSSTNHTITKTNS